MDYIYKKLDEREIYPGLEVVYHSIIDSDRKVLKTKVLTEVKTVGQSKMVRVDGVSGGVYIDALEMKSEYLNRTKA